MYYDYIMRKFYLFSILLLAASPVLQAASTCETRVDHHQNATTAQRVEYCLNDDTAVAEPDGPELVYYGIKVSAPEKEKEGTGRETQYFNGKKVKVNRDYVGTQNFPVFENDIPSEQELIAQQQAMEKISRAQKPARLMKGVVTPAGAKADFLKPAATTTATTASAASDTASVETQQVSAAQQTKPAATQQPAVKEDLKTRQKKPERFMKAVAAAPQTPAVEMQEAQLVEDEPLTPITSNLPEASATPSNEDDLLMDEETFVQPTAAPGNLTN